MTNSRVHSYFLFRLCYATKIHISSHASQVTPVNGKKSSAAKRLDFSTEAVDGDSFAPPSVPPTASDALSSIALSAAAQARLDMAASSAKLAKAEKRNKELETKLAAAYLQVRFSKHLA